MTHPLSPESLKRLTIKHRTVLHRLGLARQKAEALRIHIAELVAKSDELQSKIDVFKGRPNVTEVQ